MKSFQRLMVVAALGLGLTGCASSSYDDDADYAPPRSVATASNMPTMNGNSRVESMPGQQPLQCVPYVREHSAIKIFGDAWTWWDKAAGKYERGQSPAIGAVLVLHNYAGPNHGHVAVVKRMVSSREIRIDHANWLNDGSIYVNNPVVDVSSANDWSQVRVFNIQTGGWGAKIYPVKGFIGAGSGSDNRAPLAPPRETPRSAPPPAFDDEEQDDAPLSPDTDALIAEVLQLAPKTRMASAPATVASRPALIPVAANPSRNPPAGSPYALTPEDLAIP